MLRPQRTDDPSAWKAPLRRLYSQLVTPLEAAGVLEHKRELLIVPHRELHYLPFAALLEPTAPSRFLFQRYELGLVSSAAVWLQLGTRDTASGRTRLLALAPRQRDLPGASAEAKPLPSSMEGRRRARRQPRHERGADGSGSGHSIIHLASLGVLNKHNPQFSYIALAPSSGSDGRLEVHDVARLSLDARLVVLSACRTGLSSGRLADVPAGDDWVGLVQAFESAGAGSVLATLWPVDDRATSQLMKRFYVALREGHSESAALAIAQRGTLAARESQGSVLLGGIRAGRRSLTRGRDASCRTPSSSARIEATGNSPGSAVWYWCRLAPIRRRSGRVVQWRDRVPADRGPDLGTHGSRGLRRGHHGDRPCLCVDGSGTAPGGDSVTIDRLGGGPSAGTRMADGGFDPIAVEAEAGDTLAISVLHETGATDTTSTGSSRSRGGP